MHRNQPVPFAGLRLSPALAVNWPLPLESDLAGGRCSVPFRCSASASLVTFTLTSCVLPAVRVHAPLVPCSPPLSDLFNLRYSAKSLATEAKKSEKNAASNKIKCKKAMEVRHTTGTRSKQQRKHRAGLHSLILCFPCCVDSWTAREHGGCTNLR